MRSGVERCFMELFAVCIHINNVDPQKLVQVENGRTLFAPTVDIIQNSCGQFVQTNDL